MDKKATKHVSGSPFKLEKWSVFRRKCLRKSDRGPARDLLHSLEKCDSCDDHDCQNRACHYCTDKAALCLSTEARKYFDQKTPLLLATFVLAADNRPLSSLKGNTLPRFKNRKMKEFYKVARVHCPGCIFIGAVDICYGGDPDHPELPQHWNLHIHGIISVEHKQEIEQALRSVYRKKAIKFEAPCQFKTLNRNDLDKVCRYILKPGHSWRKKYDATPSLDGKSKSPTRCLSLPEMKEIQIALWLSNYKITDFLFLHGVRVTTRKDQLNFKLGKSRQSKS